MKTIIPKYAVWAAVAALLFSSSAFAKKKPDNLSIFAGKYSGTVTFATPTDTKSGTATVIITVPKNGKSATIGYTAVVTDSGGTTVLPTFITLTKSKTISVTDIGVGIAGTNNAHRADGTYSQHKKTLSLFATNGDTNFTVTGLAKDAGRKRQLTLTLVSTDVGSGDGDVFTTVLTAKLPKVH